MDVKLDPDKYCLISNGDEFSAWHIVEHEDNTNRVPLCGSNELLPYGTMTVSSLKICRTCKTVAENKGIL